MVKAIARSRVASDTEVVCKEVDKVIIRACAFSAIAIGTWVIACLVGATIQAGGPLPLVMGYFSAISGGSI